MNMLRFPEVHGIGRYWGEPEMSDLESVRHARDATITEVAGGKLRSLGRSVGQQTSNEGLLDAFAEVFARMSEAKLAAPSHEQPDLPEDSIQASHESDQDSEADSQSDESRTHCVAMKQDDESAEEVALPATSIAEIAAVKEIEPQQDEEVEPLETADPDMILAVVLDAEVSDTEVTAEEVIEQEVRQVLPRETAEEGWGRRRKTKSTIEAKPAEGKSLENAPIRDVVTSEESEAELGSIEMEDEPEQPLEDSGGETRRARRNRHRHGRNLEQNQEPVLRSSQRNSAAKADLVMNPEVLEAAGITERSSLKGQEPPTQAAVNRSAQAAAVASSVASTGVSAAPRSATALGSGVREGTFNPSVDAATKAVDRPASESRGKKTGTTDTLARVKLIQRVSKAFQHLGPEGGVIRMRLAPAEMGSVRVEMRIQQRKVAARVVAETEAASAALREHLPDLRAKLESFGMQVEQLEIETENLDQERGSRFEDPSSRDEKWQQPQRGQQRESFKQIQPSSVADVSQHVSLGSTVATLTEGIDVRL